MSLYSVYIHWFNFSSNFLNMWPFFLALFVYNIEASLHHYKKHLWGEWFSQENISLDFDFCQGLYFCFLFNFPVIHCFRHELYQFLRTIFRYSIIHVCRIMLYTFLLSIYAIVTFFNVISFFWRVCYSLYMRPFIPLFFFLKYPFCSQGNSSQFTKWKISVVGFWAHTFYYQRGDNL